MIDLLVQGHHLDPQRNFMNGGSNGGTMTFVYAVQRTEKLAAIAPVVGAMCTFENNPSAPLPILMIHGG